MANNETIAEREELMVDQMEGDAALLHQMVHGDVNQVVTTGGGALPSLAKWQNDAGLFFEDAANRAETALDAGLLNAGICSNIAEGLLKTVSGEHFSVPAPNSTEYLILYRNNAGAAVEVKRYPSTDAFVQLKALAPFVRNKPRGKNRGKDPMVMGVRGTQMLVAVQMRAPRARNMGPGTVMMSGRTPLTAMTMRPRPRGPSFKCDVVVVSGRTVVFQSSASATPAPVAAVYDQKLLQEQNQAPAPSLFAAISDGQVLAYRPDGGQQVSLSGAWLSAMAGPFNVIRALGSSSGPARPHSITQDGRAVREGNVLLHKLVTGQSLALGSRGIILDPNGDVVIDGKTGRLFSGSTPVGYADKLYTLPGGPRPTSWVGATALEPVRESASGVVAETPATSYMLAMRRWHERSTAVAPRLMYSVSAVGGTAYAGIKKGTATYTNALAHVTAAKSIAASNGWDYEVPSLSIVHGESQIGTSQAEYVAILNEWVGNYRADIVAITGQAVPPVAFISQMLTGESGTIPGIPLAQLQAHNENPGIVMVGPKYAYPYFDTYHMLAEGYVKMGELEARAERLTQVTGKWQPLKVVSASVSGAVITLKLNNLPGGNAAVSGPIGPLTLDTALVSNPGNFGFQLSAGTISSVKLGADGASIVITASAALSAGTVLSYALQSALGSPQTGNGRRGCVRDNDLRDFSRFDNKPLYNWLCAFALSLEIPA
ncbi:hypothetical protein [Pseudomonas alloputida]|uniref:hypothetical protein n=1 Tax=Pseudomonas alloputida TaxID=1940621 RepID=UPI001E455F42|nr:hypothetical protein [Pseudomonas alloputida]MCE0871056.1 hypothetical protein [Pseudomonas alloputida]